ncbi:hypothetical protein D3C84_1029940 [compost metagenome]
MSQALRVEVLNLVGHVMDKVLFRLEQCNGVMVGPCTPTIQSQEGRCRAVPIGFFNHQIGGQHAKHLLVPVQVRDHVLHADCRMAETQHLRGAFIGPLHITEALFLLRRIEGQRRAQG